MEEFAAGRSVVGLARKYGLTGYKVQAVIRQVITQRRSHETAP